MPRFIIDAAPNPAVDDDPAVAAAYTERKTAARVVAALTRWESADSPTLADARRAHDLAALAEHAVRVTAAHPDLTPAQRDRVARLLRGGASA